METIATEQLVLSPQRADSALPNPTPQEYAQAEKYGLMIPVVIRQQPQYNQGFESYEIMANEKTWYIAQKLQMPNVPVVRIEVNEEEAEALLAITPNNPIDEARQIKQYLTDHPQSIAAVARKLGRKRADVSNQLRLLTLDAYCQTLVQDKQLTMGQAKPLVTLPAEEQRRLAQQAVFNRWSARTLEHKAREIRHGKSVVNESSNSNVNKLEQQIAELVGCPVQLQDGKLVINYFDDLMILEGILIQMGLQHAPTPPPVEKTEFFV